MNSRGGIRKSENQGGFTLLELLVSLTILAAMAAILFASFRMSVKAWTRGDVVIEGVQRFRIMSELVRRQLSCAYALNLKGLEIQGAVDDENAADMRLLRSRGVLRTVGPPGLGGSPFYQGTSTELKFLSLYPLRRAENMGLVFISYATEPAPNGQGYRLVEREWRYLGGDSLPEPSLPSQEEKVTVVFDNLEEARFQYYGVDVLTGDSSWEDTWDGASKDSLPKAVALDITLREDVGGMGLKHRFVTPVVADSFRSRIREGMRGIFQNRQQEPE